jgi:hypothetical protein
MSVPPATGPSPGAESVPNVPTDAVAWAAKMLTTSQVGRRLGLTDQSVRAYMRSGRLRYLPTPHGALFDPTDVEQLRREREARITGSPVAAEAR